MQTVRLGRTRAEVSAVGLGCGGHSRLGMKGGATLEDASRLVRAALDLGVTFIDTAPSYGTEPAVGLGIRGRRDQVFISTKIGLPRDHSANGDDDLIGPDELVASLERSLKALGTDYLDVLHFHGLNEARYSHALQRLLPEMKRQQEAGKIRFLGATELFQRDTDHKLLARALPQDHFDVVMVGFNLLNPSARKTVFPVTLKQDVGTLVMFAVRRALSQPEAAREAVEQLIASGQVAAGDVDCGDPLGFLLAYAGVGSVVEAAYRFCRHEPGAQVILTGTGNVEHLKANIAAIQGPPLPAALSERLASVFGAVDSLSGN